MLGEEITKQSNNKLLRKHYIAKPMEHGQNGIERKHHSPSKYIRILEMLEKEQG